jgi:hypothetical protein
MFLDPGDGSFLRPYLTKAELDTALYRPTFAGPRGVRSGAVLDINDTAPYCRSSFRPSPACPRSRTAR